MRFCPKIMGKGCFLLLFWEGFLEDFATCLTGFAPTRALVQAVIPANEVLACDSSRRCWLWLCLGFVWTSEGLAH